MQDITKINIFELSAEQFVMVRNHYDILNHLMTVYDMIKNLPDSPILDSQRLACEKLKEVQEEYESFMIDITKLKDISSLMQVGMLATRLNNFQN